LSFFLSEILLYIPSVGCRIYDASDLVIERAYQITYQDFYFVADPTPTSLSRAPLVFEFHLFLFFAFAHLACAAFFARSLAVGVPAGLWSADFSALAALK
jgi:hypothetical protein